MKNLLRHIEKSITIKLNIAIGLLIIVVSFAFWYAVSYKQSKDVLAIAATYGDSFIEYVKERTRHNMLSSRKHDIEQIFEEVSFASEVERVRMFDHQGTIIHSTEKQDVGTPIDKRSIACTGCHPSGTTLTGLSTNEMEETKWQTSSHRDGHTVLTIVGPILNEPSCFTAACHKHPASKQVIGFLEADISLALFDSTRTKQVTALLGYTMLFLMAILASLAVILKQIVTDPVTRLSQSIRKVTSGDLDHSVPVLTRDEMGRMAERFNIMISELKVVKERMDAWTDELRVEISRKTDVIKAAHADMLQAEKLASLGRMAEGIANELDAPLNEIALSSQKLKTRAALDSSMNEDLNLIIEQAERSDKIIRNFLEFAKVRQAEKGEVRINDLLRKTVFMLKNQKRFVNVTIDTRTEDIPVIDEGDTSQFQQVFLHLLTNAAEAMNGKGTITVSTRKVSIDDKVYIEAEFKDEGPGIKDEDIPRLFEPFFSTKPEERSAGLGLAVCHGIVSHLGGHIEVKSTLGEGTSFFARFPV